MSKLDEDADCTAPRRSPGLTASHLCAFLVVLSQRAERVLWFCSFLIFSSVLLPYLPFLFVLTAFAGA